MRRRGLIRHIPKIPQYKIVSHLHVSKFRKIIGYSGIQLDLSCLYLLYAGCYGSDFGARIEVVQVVFRNWPSAVVVIISLFVTCLLYTSRCV